MAGLQACRRQGLLQVTQACSMLKAWVRELGVRPPMYGQQECCSTVPRQRLLTFHGTVQEEWLPMLLYTVNRRNHNVTLLDYITLHCTMQRAQTLTIP